MSEWKIDIIENLVDIIDYRGKTPEKSEVGIPTLSAKSVKMNHIDYSNAYVISQETYKKFMVRGFPQIGDVLMTTEAPLGCVARLDRDGVGIAQRLLTLRGKNNIIDNGFLLYYLQSPIGQHKLNERATGTTVIGIKQKEFRQMEVIFPNLETQKQIAKILSTIDEKIETNNKINQNLEEQAQAIFKSWFIDFEPFGRTMPNDWNIKTINEISKEVICGKTPSTKNNSYYNGNIPFITIPDMHNKTYVIETARYLTESGANTQKNKFLPKNSVCVSCIATAGLVSLVDVTSQTNQQINTIIPKKEISSFFIYLYLKNLSEYIQTLGSSGSTTCNLNKVQFSKIEILTPDEKHMTIFHKTVSPMFETIRILQYQSQKLIKLRNTLLPRLMSGEIDVSKIEI